MSRTNGLRWSGWLSAAALGFLLTVGAVVPGANAADPAPRQMQMAEAAQEIGEVTELSGEVTAQRADGGQASLQVGAAVRQGDTLVSGPDASVKVRLADGTQFAMGRNGRLTLNELVYNQQGSDDSLVAEAAQGVASVAEATDQQAESTEAVATMADEAAETARTVAANVSEVAAANEQQTERVEEIRAATRRLTDD